MTNVDIDVQQTTDLALHESKQLLEEVASFGVTSVEQYNAAGDLLRRVKGRQREVEAERKGILRPFDEARDRIMNLFAPVQKNLTDAERLLKASMLDWHSLPRGSHSRLGGSMKRRIRYRIFWLVARVPMPELVAVWLIAAALGRRPRKAKVRDAN